MPEHTHNMFGPAHSHARTPVLAAVALVALLSLFGGAVRDLRGSLVVLSTGSDPESALQGAYVTQWIGRAPVKKPATITASVSMTPIVRAAPAESYEAWFTNMTERIAKRFREAGVQPRYQLPNAPAAIPVASATIQELLGAGRDGDVLITQNGEPVWMALSRLVNDVRDAGTGRKPYDPSGGEPRRYGGGGESTSTTIVNNTTTTTTGGGWTQSDTDGLYVNVTGDTMSGGSLTIEYTGTAAALVVRGVMTGWTLAVNNLKNCNTIDTDADGNLICGTDEGGVAASKEVGTAAFTGAVQTIGDSRYVNTSGDTMTGNLTIGVTGGNQSTIALRVLNAFSGAVIHAEKSLSTSGTLVWEGAASGASLYVATSINGAGLADCDLSTQKLLWDSATGRFSCGTDLNTTAWSNTGALQTRFDARYVNVAGDTMTGVLTIGITGGNNATLGLNVINTISGSVIRAQKTLASSGTLVWEGAASGATLYVATSLNGAGLVDCDIAGTSKLLWDATTGRFSCGTDTDTNTTYTAGQGLSLNGTAFSLNTTITGALVRFQTVSGSVLRASATLASSGTLVWEGAASGASLYVASSINGAGLTDCDAASQVLKWDTTTGRFSCGTVTTNSFGSGNVIAVAEDRYVNTSGDTMTGTLTINVTGGNNGTIGLRVINALSGSTIHAEKSLSTSGTLVWEGAASGASLYVASSIRGSGLVDCDIAGTSKLLWDATTGLFSCGTDTDTDTNTTYTAGQGLTLNGTVFSLSNTITGALLEFTTVSGSTVYGTNSVRSSGSLVWEGAGSGASLYVATSLRGSGLTDCDLSTQKLQWDTTTGRFSCATDLTGGGGTSTGAIQAYLDNRYVNTSGDSMTGALTINVTGGNNSTLGLVVMNTISGSVIRAQKTLASSGTLVWEGAASGASLWVSAFDGAGLTDCDAASQVLKWDMTTKRFSCGTVTSNSFGSGNVIALGDARYVNTSGDTMTGALTINVTNGNNATLGLNVINTVSGAVIRAQKTLASSGTLVWEGAASGASLYVASSLQGAGLVDCDIAGASKLLWDATTGRFSCGTDQSAGSGLDQNSGDDRYVRKSGDTMTGALVINVTGGNNATLGLNVINTISGSVIRAQKTLASSGTLIWEGAASGATLYVATSLNGAGLVDCDIAGTSKLLWDSTTGRFSCGTDQNTQWSNTGSLQTYFDPRYVNVAGDTMTGALTINLTSGTVGLEVIQTISGSTIFANKQLATSGSLIVESNITLGSSTSVVYLGSNTLLHASPDGTNTFLGVRSGNLSVSGTENAALGTFTLFNADSASSNVAVGYSALRSLISGANNVAIGKNAGYNITSGSDNIFIGNFAGYNEGGSNKLYIDNSGTDLPLLYGDFSTDALTVNGALEITGNLSGSTLKIANLASFSGAVVLEGGLTGSTINGFGLPNGGCNASTQKLLWNVSTGKFSCATDLTGGGGSSTGSLQTYFDNRYVNTSGDTMTGTLTINITGGNNATVGLRVLNTMSGAFVYASKGVSTSGALLTESGAIFDGGTLYVDANNNRVGIGTTTPGAMLDIAGNFATTGYPLRVTNPGYYQAYFQGTDPNDQVSYYLENDRGSFQSYGGFLLGGSTSGLGNIFGQNRRDRLFMFADGSSNLGMWVGTLGAQPFTIGTNNAEVLRVNAAGNVGIGTTSPRGKLEVIGSGTFVGAISGASLYVATSINGAGLVDCDIAGTSKLLWDSTTGRFSCGTDQNTQWSNTGSLQARFDGRYVNTFGDTMTGALTISVTGGNNSTLALNVLNTISGSYIRAQKTLASSGTLVWEGAASGASLYIATAFEGAGLTDCDTAGTSKLLWDATTKRFSCGTDQTGGGAGGAWSNTGSLQTYFDARYVNTSGDSMTGALTISVTGGNNATVGLNVINTISGSYIRAQKTITSSGSLVWEGTASGGILTISRSVAFAGSGLILSHSGITVFNENSRNVDFRIEGDTNDALFFLDASTDRISIGSRTPKAMFDVYGTMSGRALIINGTMSGRNLVVMGSGSALRPLMATLPGIGGVGIGTSTPRAKLDIASGSFLMSPGGPPVTLGGLDLSIGVNDIAVQGKLTFLALDSVAGNDFRIVDNTLATAPVTLSGADFGGNVRAVAVAGKYAYVGLASNGSHPELIAYDVSNPSNIVRLGGVELGRDVTDLQVVDGLLYVTMAANFSTPEFAIYSVANPFDMRRIWEQPSSAFADATTVFVSGRYAYVGYASSMDADFRIYDVSNPTSTVLRGSLELSNSVRSIYVSGKYAYIGLDAAAGNDFRIYDVSNPNATPVSVGGIETNANVLSVQVANRLAYISLASVAGTDFRIIDVNVPSAPTTVGGIDVSIGANRAVISGKTAYLGLASAAGNDYRILELNGIDAPTAVIGAIVSNALSVTENASIANILTVGNSMTVGPGGLYSQGTINVMTGSGGNSMTGVLIRSRGKSGALLALDSYTDTGAKAPHIAFGYRGNFDTYLARSGTGLTVKAQTTRTDITVFRVMTDATNVNNTRFRVHGDGNAFADGSFTGGGADYAEYFMTSTPNLVQGELVCIDVTKANTVKRCASPADGNVMGIVSSLQQAAFIGNKFKDLDGLPVPGTVLVGLIGQLSTKAMVESGAVIRPGDELTPASKPGYARKAMAGEPTVGVALSGLAKGNGMIDVLIARKNGSMTAAAVSDRVLETVKTLKIEDEMKLSLQKTIDELTDAGSFSEPVAAEVQKQIAALSVTDRLSALEQKVDSLGTAADGAYAEWFAALTAVKVGDAVCIDSTRTRAVAHCTNPADATLVGVITQNASMIGNTPEGLEGAPSLVSLAGETTVNASALSRPIRAGDPLTNASDAGLVRRAQNGEPTIGVALESLESGVRAIRIRISRSGPSVTVETLETRVEEALKGTAFEETLRKELDRRVASGGTTPAPVAGYAESLNVKGGLTVSGALIAMGEATIGTLTVNDTFTAAGDARIGGDLHLEGALIASELFVPGTLSIDGSAVFGGDVEVKGSLTFAPGSKVVLSDLIVENALQVIGDVTIEGMAIFVKDVTVRGQLIVSSSQAGFAVIPASDTSVTVRFASGFTAQPVVTASPDVPVAYAVTKTTQTGFTIRIASPASETITFSWHALATEKPRTSTGGTVGDFIVFPVDGRGVPLSSDEMWNQCIRGRQPRDAEGSPYDCSPHHDGTLWQHPDLAMSFTWNEAVVPPLLQLPDGYQAVSQSVSAAGESSASSEASSSSDSSEASSVAPEASSSEEDSVFSDSSASSASSDSSLNSSESSSLESSVSSDSSASSASSDS